MSGIKLEVGQRVRLRNGKVHDVKPTKWKCDIDQEAYLESGHYYGDFKQSDLDVIEILPPEPAQVPTVELGKWYPCRNGLSEGKIFETGLPGKFRMVGFCRTITDHKDWCPCSWTSEGLSNNHRDLDLMLAPPEPKRHTLTRWVNCYVEDEKVGLAGPHETRERADECASSGRIACVTVKIEFFEGEGLEPKQP